VLSMCLINDPPTDWDDVIERGVKNWKGKDLKAVMARLCLSASVYAIWKEMNNIRHGFVFFFFFFYHVWTVQCLAPLSFLIDPCIEL
jgi:hypothetical protein